MSKETSKTIRYYENLYEIYRKKLIKQLKQKKLSTLRLIELEKDFKNFMEVEKTLLYLYCDTFEVGKDESPKESL